MNESIGMSVGFVQEKEEYAARRCRPGVGWTAPAKKNAPAERTSRMASVFAGIAGQGPGVWFNLYVELSSTCYQSLRGAGLV